MAGRGRLSIAAVVFGGAAAFASWNPLAAPFGLVVGLAALLISVRAVRGGERRQAAAAGLALSILGVAASALVLALTAGVGRDPVGEPVVAGPTREEAARALDAEARRTEEARARARRELEEVDRRPGVPAGDQIGPAPPRPRRGGAPRRRRPV